ncbi:hypothetical protein ACXIUS_28930 [Bosea thiooxidans]
MLRLTNDGWTAMRIAGITGHDINTVMNTVRRVIPNAFRRGVRRAEFTPANDTVRRRMPFDISWSTDPRTHHDITLPRLRCLERAC